MQKLKCEVALAGDVRQLVPKEVTVPELLVLQAIHGQGSVLNITPAGMDKRTHSDELARLHRLYGKAGEEEGANVVARLFPGYAPQLPVRLSDIGMAESDADADKPKKKKVGKKKASKKTAAKPADGDDNEDSTPEKGGEDDNDALS